MSTPKTERAALCSECGAPRDKNMGPGRPRKFCGPRCANTNRQRAYRERKGLAAAKPRARKCGICLRTFKPVTARSKAKTCGEHCKTLASRRYYLKQRVDRALARAGRAEADLERDIALLRRAVAS